MIERRPDSLSKKSADIHDYVAGTVVGIAHKLHLQEKIAADVRAEEPTLINLINFVGHRVLSDVATRSAVMVIPGVDYVRAGLPLEDFAGSDHGDVATVEHVATYGVRNFPKPLRPVI